MFKTSKKISVSLISLSLISIIASCSSNNLPITATTSVKASSDFSNSNLGDVKLQQLIQSNTTKGENVFIADAGNGQKTSASFAFKIDLNKNSFKTKLSSSGKIYKATDVAILRVYLLDSLSIPTGDFTSLIGAGSTVGPFDVTFSGTPKTILFKNVKQNMLGGRFYVAVAASSNATFVAGAPILPTGGGTNITKLSGAPINLAGDPFYVTDLGGNDGTGFVTVNSVYAVGSTAPLTTTLTLADAVGATVESTVTVSNGSAVDPVATTAS